MPRSPRPRPLAGLLLLLAPIDPALAATQDSQAWITEHLTIRAGSANIVTIDSSQRARSDGQTGGEQFLARVAIDHAIAPQLQLGGGMAYLKGEADQELRLFQQVTLVRGIWTGRTRMEQRFFSTANEPIWRLRQRVQAAVPIDPARRWTVIAAAEIFLHLNRARPSDKAGLAMMRHQIGLRHPITATLDAQLLYMRQHTLRDGRPDIVAHIPWLTLSWRL